jgi:hypothetical protein
MEDEIKRHDTKFDDLGTTYILPPQQLTPFLEKIASRESRDVPEIIEALNRNKKPSWSDVTAYRHALDALATS